MNQKTLAEYIETHGQTETARRAGLSQGAIWQMVKSGRRIFVADQDDGSVLLEEKKTIKRTASA